MKFPKAEHNADYIMNWRQAFSKYKAHDVFIIGESYAGVYITTLVRELLKRQKLEQDKDILKLKGFAIGDGCMGTSVNCGSLGNGPYYTVEFLRGHGQFSEKTYEKIKSICSKKELAGYGYPMSVECSMILKKMQEEVGGFYTYSLYDDCWYQNDLNPPHHMHNTVENSMSLPRHYWGPPGRSLLQSESLSVTQDKIINNRSASYNCGGPNALFTWIEKDEVKHALNVPLDAYFFSGDNGKSNNTLQLLH